MAEPAQPLALVRRAAAVRRVLCEQVDRLARRPTALAVTLIGVSAMVRLVLMWAIGFGNDEAYTMAAARELHLSYFDHPPLHIWIAHAASRAFGETLWVRLPTVLLFAGTGWLMVVLARHLFGASAGLWALLALTLTPFFTVSAGGWIVPDGPLTFFLLAAVCAVAPVLFPREPIPVDPWWPWMLSGLFFGLAGLSKYTAALEALGLIGFLATSARHRPWLRHPAPYAGAVVALLVVSPVLVWNAEHQWASFAFQGSRGLPGAGGVHPVQVLAMIGGEFAFLSPWIAVPVVVALADACRTGGDQRHHLLIWLALPAIIVFTIAPFWSPRGLPHWAMPGWLFAFPLLGVWISEGHRRWFAPRRWALGAALAFASIIAVAVDVTAFGLPWDRSVDVTKDDPLLESFAWTGLRSSEALQAMHVDFAITTRWMDAGKIAMALGPAMPVAVYSNDPRQFAFAARAGVVGCDAAIIVPARLLDETLLHLRAYFASLDAAEFIWLGRQGRSELELALVHAHRLRQPFPNPYVRTAAAETVTR